MTEEEKKEDVEIEVDTEKETDTDLQPNEPNQDETPLNENDGISNKEIMDFLMQLQQQFNAFQNVQDTANPIEANAEPETEEVAAEEEAPSEPEKLYDDEEEINKVDALLNEK